MSLREYLDRYDADRAAALLSLDVNKVRALARKYGGRIPEDPDALRIEIHRARTMLPRLPIEARRLSKQWLAEHGYESSDETN
jgi:hypothetical protein